MADPEGARATGRSAPALVKAFEEAKDDDPRVRRYLALAIGRLDPPLPREAIAALTKALDEPDDGMDARLVSRVQRLDRHRDQRGPDQHHLGARLVRRRDRRADACSRCTSRRTRASGRWWSTRSARCLATRRSTRCGRRSRTTAPDVRWNAAVALARHGSREGVPVLRQMLDRALRRADGQARRRARTKTWIRWPT